MAPVHCLKLLFSRAQHLVKLVFIDQHVKLRLQILLKLIYNRGSLPDLFHGNFVLLLLQESLTCGPCHLTNVTSRRIVRSLCVFKRPPAAQVLLILLTLLFLL